LHGGSLGEMGHSLLELLERHREIVAKGMAVLTAHRRARTSC
jgi:hypothetical protein